MSKHYLLDAEHNLVPTDLLTWAKALEKNRTLARTRVYDGCEVSTVFLGLDHRFGSQGPPLVFETLVFGGPFDQHMERYATWEEAVAGHAKVVDMCQPILTESLPDASQG